MSPEVKGAKSAAIQQFLKDRLKSENGSWAGFHSLSSEPNIQWQELAPHIHWTFPVVNGETMSFHNHSTELAKSQLGVLEPVGTEAVDARDIVGVFVPGVAFSRSGHRLGRGRGYFDRTLNNYKGKKIGVCFSESLFDEIPKDDFDICCDEIITDTECLVISSQKGEGKWN